MAQSTAGKGPGLVLRAGNRSGALRVSIASRQRRALLELMDPGGQVVEVGLSLDAVKTLSQVLRKVTLALGAQTLDDETTPSRPGPPVKAPSAARRKRSGRFGR